MLQELAARVVNHQTEWKTRMQSVGMQPID
jgi:hypothetical protein